MPEAAYHGRHRAPARGHRAAPPRLTASGYLLPTAAAAVLVVTATGARIDVSAPSAAAGTAPSAAAGTAPTALTVSAFAAEDLIARDLQDRAARSATRGTAADTATATDAVPAGEELARFDGQAAAAARSENDARVAAEAAAQAQAQAQAAQAQAQAAQAQAQADAAAQAKAKADAAAARAWTFPVGGAYSLTSGFGMRWGAMHPGQDFATPVGTPVKAMSSGTVVFAGWQGSYGYKVEIRYWDGTVSWYAHNSKVLVSQGEAVTPGELVALSGNTGNSTGPHVHIEIHPGDGQPVSPVPWLTKLGLMS